MINGPEEYLNTMKLVVDSDCATSIVLIKRIREKDGNYKYEFYKINITQEIGSDFRKILSTRLNSISKGVSNGTNEILSYDCSTRAGNHVIESIDSDEIKNFNIFYQEISNLNNLEIAKKIDKKFIDSLWCYAIKIENKEGKNIIYFRKYTKSKVFTRGLIHALVFNNGSFDKIKKDLFIFDGAVDCIFFDKQMLILNRFYFERIFDFFSEFKVHSEMLLDNLKTRFNIENFDLFKEHCLNDKRIMRRLSSIHQKKYYEQINFESIKKVKGDFDLPITLLEREGKQVIGWGEDKKNIFAVIDVFDDAYLTSPTTQNKYEVDSKKER